MFQVGHSGSSPSPMAGSQPVQRVKSMFGQSTGKLPPPRLPAHPPPPQRSISHSEVSSQTWWLIVAHNTLLRQSPCVKPEMRAAWQPPRDYGHIKWLVSSVSGLPGSANVRVQCVRLQPQPGLPGSVLQSPGEAGGWPLEARAVMIITTASPSVLCVVKVKELLDLNILHHGQLFDVLRLWNIIKSSCVR